eukprot:scaffold35353_cov39-Cyclotella_meneghiniana.AAC.9
MSLLHRILQEETTSGDSPETTPWKVHGWLGFFAWGVFVPLAVMSSVFRRSLPADGIWFRIHSTLNGMAYAFTVVAVTIAIVYTQKEGYPHFNGPHKRMGLAMVILASVQVLAGLFRPAKPNSSTSNEPDNNNDTTQQSVKKSSRRVAFEAGHRLLGVSLLLCGFWQIYRGVHLYDLYYTLDQLYQRCRSKRDGVSQQQQSTSWRNDETEPESVGVEPPSVS